MNEVKLGFELQKLRLPLDCILPVRQIKDSHGNFARYKIIIDSIKEVGMIEPLMVHPQKGEPGKYVLLDGHYRHFALKELGQTEADCLISTDDESYTYNARINRINPVQEHKMIVKAVQNGVPLERIAAALSMPVRIVKALLSLLDGIHEEAAHLLKDKAIAPKAIRLLKKVNNVRQIEIAELMVSANNYSISYTEALILGTPKDQLIDQEEPKKKSGFSAEDIARLEEEMDGLERNLKVVEESYGENMLNMTLARGYVKKLLDNAKVARFLAANHGDILSEFQLIASAEAL